VSESKSSPTTLCAKLHLSKCGELGSSKKMNLQTVHTNLCRFNKKQQANHSNVTASNRHTTAIDPKQQQQKRPTKNNPTNKTHIPLESHSIST